MPGGADPVAAAGLEPPTWLETFVGARRIGLSWVMSSVAMVNRLVLCLRGGVLA